MKKLFVKKILQSHSSDAFNNPMYAYFFRYGSPDSHGYMTIMTEEAYMRLREILTLGSELTESDDGY